MERGNHVSGASLLLALPTRFSNLTTSSRLYYTSAQQLNPKRAAFWNNRGLALLKLAEDEDNVVIRARLLDSAVNDFTEAVTLAEDATTKAKALLRRATAREEKGPRDIVALKEAKRDLTEGRRTLPVAKKADKLMERRIVTQLQRVEREIGKIQTGFYD